MNRFVADKYVRMALEEDIGHSDLTSDILAETGQTLKAVMNTRVDGIVCGIHVVEQVFQMLSPQISIHFDVKEGDRIKAGQDLVIIEGDAAAVLTGERTALNFIQRMSAIATTTDKYQQTIKPYKARITDTRKNTPNFRLFEKYSVQVGGGSPHRYGLFDCVMIKDNHIQMAGSLTNAVQKAKSKISHTTKIEVETENLEMVKEALNAGADIIMLDNMSVKEMEQAVKIIDGKAITEASGTVSLETVNDVASSGVDYISTSAIHARAGILDIGLDICH